MSDEHAKQIASYKTLVEALRSELNWYKAKDREYREAVETLASERAANALLTAELEAIKAKPIPVFEFDDGYGGDFVEEIDVDWVPTLPAGTKLYYLGPE